MKRFAALFIAVVMCVLALASCGKSDKLYDYNFEEYLTLGKYKGVEVSITEIEKEFEEQVNAILDSNAKDVDTEAPAAKGNKVVYSYTATIDGEASDALKRTDAKLTIGSGSSGLTALDEALVGMSAKETKEVTVEIPDSFTKDETLAGKTAVLTVTVSAVTKSVVPETLTDEMVSTATEEQYKTVSEYEEYLRSAIKQSLAWKSVIANTTFIKYPEKEAEMYYEQYLAPYKTMAAQYGMTIASLASAYGMTEDAFYSMLAQQAVTQVNQEMAVLLIAEKENLVPDDARIQAKIDEMVAYYGYDSEEAFLKDVTEAAIAQSATYDMVMEFIKENAVEVEGKTEGADDAADTSDEPGAADTEAETGAGTEEAPESAEDTAADTEAATEEDTAADTESAEE
ncbi:MAG: FKBP-type peptidyl-prolyl cis-trans isomerase [Clostridia bacterium]|nr:FKBP-type peptidyl-prolyl cis-trans isomerase [Clostridia bacterium]